jgi:hypothetical protein
MAALSGEARDKLREWPILLIAALIGIFGGLIWRAIVSRRRCLSS